MNANKQKLHNFIEAWQEWKLKYHTNEHGEIIFQCERLLTNIVFNQHSFHSIKNHLKGFEHLPDTVMTPQECWSYWQDPKTQLVVLRNYIKDNFVVQTVDGIITDAFLVDNVHRFRKGVILY